MNIVLEREPKTQAAGIDQTASGGAPAGPRARIGRSIKIVPQLDKYPKLVSFGQTAVGQAALLGAFAAGLVANHVSMWIEMTVAMALIVLFPARRRLLVSVAGMYWLFFHSTWLNWTFLRAMAKSEGQKTDWTLTVLVFGILAAVFCGFALYFQYVRRVRARRASVWMKRPVWCLLAVYAAMLATAGLLPLGGMMRLLVWGVIAVMAPYLWYFSYALKDALAKTPDGATLQFGTLQPFWGGTNVPYPKGAADLRKIEVRNSEDLSVTRLKAIKLLIWAFILRIPLLALQVFVYGKPPQGLGSIGLAHWGASNLGVPELDAALQLAALPVHIAWASLIAHFAEAMLEITISGSIIIACCRMAGFNALRNTYRPLESRTVAEFWNRYYYYFKELLVDFFFFPVFTRYFKKHRQFRLFAATMAAATLGNMLFHFFRDYRYVAQMGLWRALVGFQVYAFYTTVLGLGIGMSQWRGHGKERSRAEAKWWRRALATACVLSFFCLLEVFDQEGRTHGLGQCFRFFLHLFFIPA
jgi:hypothetical protein